MKTDLFQSCCHCWVFRICWRIECSILTASTFRILNSSAGILSPPLVFFLVERNAYLTSHSRMSGSRWVTTPLWLSGSLRFFLYSSSVYSCHLFLIFSASVRSIPFLSFIVPNFAWNVRLVSLIILKRSLVFHILLFFSIALHSSLRKALSLLAILWNSAFRWVCLSVSPLSFTSLLFSAICKPSSDSFAFFAFLFPGHGLFLGENPLWLSKLPLISSIHSGTEILKCAATKINQVPPP